MLLFELLKSWTFWIFLPFFAMPFSHYFNFTSFVLKKKKPKPKKPGPNEVYYRVRVKTGNYNNASTDANVYVTICGQRGQVSRKHLFNKYNAIKTPQGTTKFKFERNSTNTFKFIGPDVANLTHILIEVN